MTSPSSPAVYPARDMSRPLGRRPRDAWLATLSNSNG